MRRQLLLVALKAPLFLSDFTDEVRTMSLVVGFIAFRVEGCSLSIEWRLQRAGGGSASPDPGIRALPRGRGSARNGGPSLLRPLVRSRRSWAVGLMPANCEPRIKGGLHIEIRIAGNSYPNLSKSRAIPRGEDSNLARNASMHPFQARSCERKCWRNG